jgi:uncharacterized protein (TIGR02757 family)
MSRRDPTGARGPKVAQDPKIGIFLEEVYASCGGGPRLRLDPLAVVREYAGSADRELAALVCSTLAFGSVGPIMRACRAAMAPLGDRPAEALDAMGDADVLSAWSDFQYRYCFPKDMAALMLAAKRARLESGSLGAFFLQGDPGGPDIVAAASAFVRRLERLGRRSRGQGGIRDGLLADPARGSACKRLFLMLRWLVRSDAVDPGGWEAVGRARLVVPLDTHMTRVCSERLGFIRPGTPSLVRALAATAAFRLYAPDDPVKYDFALTRPGIDPEPGDERFGCT